MDRVTVRTARRDDAGAIARVRVAGWRAGYAGILEPAVLDALDPITEQARRRAEWGTRPGSLRVAEAGGEVLGFTLCGAYRAGEDDPAGSVGPSDAELQALYVDPGSWSRGVGSALIGDVVATLTAAGHPVVRLWVLAANDRARRFYARQGFVEEGISAPFTPRGGTRSVPECRYARPLP